MGVTKEQLEFQNDYELYQMKGMDAYIGIGCSDNASELSDVPSDNISLQSSILRPVLRERVDNSKWVILRYPNGDVYKRQYLIWLKSYFVCSNDN